LTASSVLEPTMQNKGYGYVRISGLVRLALSRNSE